MNLPPFIDHTAQHGSALADQALARLAQMAGAAGQPDWTPPRLAIDHSRLQALIGSAGLDRGERLALALLLAAESDPAVARMIAAVQAPIGTARPLAGLVATLFATEGLSPPGLWAGPLTTAGLLLWGEEAAPLPERSLGLPEWIVAALAGHDCLPPGVTELAEAPVHLHRAALSIAAQLAAAISSSGAEQRLLILRCSCPAEGESVLRAAAARCGLEPCVLGAEKPHALAAWLRVTGRFGVLHRRAAPGETISIGSLETLAAPLVAITGSEGQIGSARQRSEWTIPMPGVAERTQLWTEWGLAQADAESAAARLRQGAGRIAEIGRTLTPQHCDLAGVSAAMQAGGGRIDALARRSRVDVQLNDIVLPPGLADGLQRLRDRVLHRNRLGEGLGPTISARYRPGVRALFTGESGTGKTLAAHWLAGQAGLPCYRVDLAAMTSKWIGETEKNLSQLLDAAEQGDVVLFFDEADALFGARTDVGDANDRHANAQTNYLLQRIEEFDGVALMATNNRDRFDPAFVRRLDTVLEFPLPDAAARRQLWDRHLGQGHAIADDALDHLAAAIDLAGGHVRNVVLAAASRALSAGRQIAEPDLLAAIREEYAKLGRSPPPDATG